MLWKKQYPCKFKAETEAMQADNITVVNNLAKEISKTDLPLTTAIFINTGFLIKYLKSIKSFHNLHQ
jgi:hypothetical protein